MLDKLKKRFGNTRTGGKGSVRRKRKVHKNKIQKTRISQEEKEYNQIKREKLVYYTGRADREVYDENPLDIKILKNELDTFMNGDSEIIKIQTKIDNMQLMFDYVERCLKNILERQWHIKNIIEWRKFTNGVS